MEPVGTVLYAAATAPAVSGLRERAHGSSVPKPSGAKEADGQSSEVYLSPGTAALRLTRRAVEQFRTALESSQGAEEAATTAVFEIGREHAPGTEVESSLDLYA